MARTTTSRSDVGRRFALVVVLGPLLTGCAATVRLLSDPTGAQVHLEDGRVLTTPVEVELVRGALPVSVEAPGYRTLTFDVRALEGRPLRRWESAWFQRGGREVTFVLEPLSPLVGGTDDDLR